MCDIIYHYCPFAAFEKIIGNRTLRFSDLKTMDDPNEVKYMGDIYSECIREKYPEYYKYLNLDFEQNFNGIRYFSLSLSTDPESERMWSDYASEGKGAAIGFNRGKAEKWAEGFRRDDAKEAEVFGTSGYIDDYATNLLEVASYGTVDYCRPWKIKNKVMGWLNENTSNDALFPMIEKIYTEAPFNKRCEYSFENEYRFLATLRSARFNDGTFPRECSVITPKGMRRYDVEEIWDERRHKKRMKIDIPFDEDAGDSMIEKIILGPGCEHGTEEIRRLMKGRRHPDDTEIVKL